VKNLKIDLSVKNTLSTHRIRASSASAKRVGTAGARAELPA